MSGPDERGAAATELALLVPAFMLILAVMIAGSRIWLARGAVTEAASAAARAATLQRSASEAEAAARRSVSANLEPASVRCDGLDVSVDTSGFERAAGMAATVTVRVVCRVPLADVVVPGLPGTVDATAVGSSALDTYRGRR